MISEFNELKKEIEKLERKYEEANKFVDLMRDFFFNRIEYDEFVSKGNILILERQKNVKFM